MAPACPDWRRLMPVIESLVTVAQAAQLTKVSQRTFWKLLAVGRAPEVIRIGRSVRLRASDVDLWLRLGCPDRERLEAHKAAHQRAAGVAK